MLKCCKENIPSAQLYHYTMSHDTVQMPLREQIARVLDWDTTCVSTQQSTSLLGSNHCYEMDYSCHKRCIMFVDAVDA
jgi:hypothetical protein